MNAETPSCCQYPHEIEVGALTNYLFAPDGSAVCMNVLDAGGNPASIVLPTDCLRALAMTMPRMVSQAIGGGRCDSTVRAVHAVDSWTLERASDGVTAILTVQVKDSFSMSFALPDTDLKAVADAIAEHEIDAFPFGLNNH